MAIPVIVLGEYRHGIAQSRNRVIYENWLSGLLNDYWGLDIAQPTTHYYAEISLELKRKGKRIPTNDIWIAALCRQHRLPLFGRDRHFDPVAEPSGLVGDCRGRRCLRSFGFPGSRDAVIRRPSPDFSPVVG